MQPQQNMQQQQQQQQQQGGIAAGYYPTTNVSTEHIQQILFAKCQRHEEQLVCSQTNMYLDENKSLIMKILEDQNAGRLGESAENQAKLQQNLMYLAALADGQPQVPFMHAQVSPPPNVVMQPGMNYMPQQQSQQDFMATPLPMLYAQQPAYSAINLQQNLHIPLDTSASGNGRLLLMSDEINIGGLELPPIFNSAPWDGWNAMHGGANDAGVEGAGSAQSSEGWGSNVTTNGEQVSEKGEVLDNYYINGN